MKRKHFIFFLLMFLGVGQLCFLSSCGQTQEIDGKECVDLGLPSGKKWATYNEGASKIDDYGKLITDGFVT